MFYFYFCYRIDHAYIINTVIVLFLPWGILPCVPHADVLLFSGCTSDLGDEQPQFGIVQKPEDSYQGCLAEGVEEPAEA